MNRAIALARVSGDWLVDRFAVPHVNVRGARPGAALLARQRRGSTLTPIRVNGADSTKPSLA